MIDRFFQGKLRFDIRCATDLKRDGAIPHEIPSNPWLIHMEDGMNLWRQSHVNFNSGSEKLYNIFFKLQLLQFANCNVLNCDFDLKVINCSAYFRTTFLSWYQGESGNILMDCISVNQANQNLVLSFIYQINATFSLLLFFATAHSATLLLSEYEELFCCSGKNDSETENVKIHKSAKLWCQQIVSSPLSVTSKASYFRLGLGITFVG